MVFSCTRPKWLLRAWLPLLAAFLLTGCNVDTGIGPDPIPVETNYTLTVQSENPGSGIPIDIAPGDGNGAGSGESPFERVYEEGTDVTLIAPEEAPNGYPFLRWKIDNEVDEDREITVTMTGDHTVTAVFSTVRTLTVASENPDSDVLIEVSPQDQKGNVDDTTTFERFYVEGTDVHLTAPAHAPDGNTFLLWKVDGDAYSDEREISITIAEDHTATAVFTTSTTLSVASRNPDDGITVRTSPPDDEGVEGGITPFTLLYLLGQHVEIRPETISPEGHYFFGWEYDGPTPHGEQVITLEVAETSTATVVYAPAVKVVDTTYEVGGRPRGLPENEMERTLELDILTPEVIDDGRVGVFYYAGEDLTALPHDMHFDLRGGGEEDTPATYYYELAPGELTIRYVAHTNDFAHPSWLPDRVVVVIYEEDAASVASVSTR